MVGGSIGAVTQTDVELARDCKGMMVGFNAKIPGMCGERGEWEGKWRST